MSSLRSHISLILALVSIMISIFLFRIFSEILKKYERNIVDNYSIIIVSSKPLKTIPLENISTIDLIDIKEEIEKLKKSYKNIDFKGIRLPYFYKVKLNYLPSPDELNKIKNRLKKFPFIKKIMTKSSSQTKIYNLLTLLKIISNIFMLLVSTLGFLLIVKQLEVWKLLHSERMYIMELFGAPFWFRGAALFKIAFLDSIISLILAIILIIYITNHEKFIQIINELGIDFSISYVREFLVLFFISMIISISSSIIVVITGKK